ncbi:MAG: cytochrome c biogenesis protein CcdA [Candidatus Omnitrophota bacterium]
MSLSGGPADYLLAFLSGIGISLTPCVYPLIPITIGYIGIKSAGSKIKGFSLSFVYVTGIAVTYSLLGLIASLTGQFFGKISSHPLVNVFVGVIICFFGLSMLDLFSINLPRIVLPVKNKQGYFSTFLLGIISGLIIGPCVTPFLGAILVYLAEKKNILYGMSVLLTFAYGMGFILVLCGTFSSLLIGLPKSGKWMLYIKRIFAIILFAVGVYFIFTGIRRL